MLTKNRKPETKVLTKDYHAMLLISFWLEHSKEVDNYDNLILSFLESLPEDVSVKATLHNALVACTVYRRLNIRNNAQASYACAFNSAIRRQLVYWEPEADDTQKGALP